MSQKNAITMIILIIAAIVALIFGFIYIMNKPLTPVEKQFQATVNDSKNIIVFMGYVISALFVIVGFFITMYISNLNKAIDKLSMTITSMNAVVLTYVQKMDDFEIRYKEHKEACEKRFGKNILLG